MSLAKQKTVDEADFSQHSSEYLQALASGELDRLLVSSPDQIYEVRKLPSIYGCMKGTFSIPEGVDLTEPVGMEDWSALGDDAPAGSR